jgi:positive regulator of sigma E activity
VSDGGASIEALNQAGARVGQLVRVSFMSYTYVKGTFLFYGLPALALIAGAIVGKEVFASRFPGIEPDGVAAIFGFGAFALSFVLVKILSSKASKQTKYKPIIDRILDEDAPGSTES